MDTTTSFSGTGGLPGVLTTVIAIAMLVAWIIVQIMLATSVMNDIDELKKAGRAPRFFRSGGWGFVVLITGVIGFAYYWAIHHSAWRDPQSDVRV